MFTFVLVVLAVVVGYAFRGKIRKVLGFGQQEVKAVENTAVSDVKKEVNKL